MTQINVTLSDIMDAGAAVLIICCCLIIKLCLTLCNPLSYSLPVSSVHGISQVRILEWVAIPFSRESSQPRDQTHISYIGRWILYHKATWEAQSSSYLHLIPKSGSIQNIIEF